MVSYDPVTLSFTNASVTLTRVGNVVTAAATFSPGTPSGSQALPSRFVPATQAELIFIDPSNTVDVEVFADVTLLGAPSVAVGLTGASPAPTSSIQYSMQWLASSTPGANPAQPAIAPYVPTYASTQPYATAAEFNAYPTGVNAYEIIPGGSQQVLADTLSQLLIQASSEADGICNQVLACTTEVEFGSRRVDSAGYLRIPTNQFPIVEVDGLAVGLPGQTAWLTDLSQGAFPSRNVFRIPYSGATDAGWVDAQITYLAGYANALTGVAATAGATSLTLTSTLGVQPGMALRVYDPGSYENVTVTAIAGSVVTLAAPLVFAHAQGIGVSAMPAAIREAVILLTAAKIKARASESTVIAGISGGMSEKPDTEPEQFEAALDLLTPYIRV